MCKLIEQAVMESMRLNKLSGVPKEITCSKQDYDDFLRYIKDNWGLLGERNSVSGLTIKIEE